MTDPSNLDSRGNIDRGQAEAAKPANCPRPAPPRRFATSAQALLLAGGDALWNRGDRRDSRKWFGVAYNAARADGDREIMAWSALGMSGLWPHEHRDGMLAALVDSRLSQALAEVDPRTSLWLRLKARLAGESDYRTGEYEGILNVLAQARRSGDPFVRADAATLAHICLQGPGHSTLRHALAQEVIAESFLTTRRSDLLVGMLLRTVGLLIDGDPEVPRRLTELKECLAEYDSPAVSFVVQAIDVMFIIRAGEMERAEDVATVCAGAGVAAGDLDASGWHATHLFAIRRLQGRVGELLPDLTEVVNSPTLSTTDRSHLAALALAAATAGDRRAAAGAVARLLGTDLSRLPRSNTWLVTMFILAEAAGVLGDTTTAAAVGEALRPYSHLPAIAGPGVACLGSVRHAIAVTCLTTGDTEQAVTQLRAAIRANVALGNNPAAVLSRALLSQALILRAGIGDVAEAARLRDAAAADADRLGLALPPGVGRTAARPDAVNRAVTCRRQGRRWVLGFGAATAVVDHTVGMQYVAALTSNPGREIPAIRLAAGPELVSAVAVDSVTASPQPVHDEQALRAYRRRLAELEKDVATYKERGDDERAERAREERDWLVAELRVTSGLLGRPRGFADSEERARISVGKAIRRALKRISDAHPVIGAELRSAITTGRLCCYQPTPASLSA
jgi:hypothetical protein